MKNSKNKNFVCKGINSALAILESNRFNILKINILNDGIAAREPRVKNLVGKHRVSQLDKDQFYKKYSERRTQGIVVEFSGALTENRLPNFNNKSNICLLFEKNSLVKKFFNSLHCLLNPFEFHGTRLLFT